MYTVCVKLCLMNTMFIRVRVRDFREEIFVIFADKINLFVVVVVFIFAIDLGKRLVGRHMIRY